MKVKISAAEAKKKTMVAREFSTSGVSIVPKIKIMALKENVIFQTADFNKACTIRVESQGIEEQGHVIVNLNRFYGLLQGFGDRILELKTSGNYLSLTDGTVKASLQLLTEEEFPQIPMPNPNSSKIQVDTKALLEALNKVQFACQQTKSGGLPGFKDVIYFKSPIVFATNSIKIGVLNRDFGIEHLRVPINTVKHLDVFESEQTIVTPEPDRMFFKCGDYLFSFAEINAHPPEIDRILEMYSKPVVIYNMTKDQVASFVTYISQFTAIAQQVTLYCVDNGIYIAAIGETDTAIVKMECERNQKGTPLIVSYNGSFLLSALKEFDKEVELGFFGEKNPVLIRNENMLSLVQAVLFPRERAILDLVKETIG